MLPTFAPYCHSGTRTRIIGLDIAKNQTGVGIIEVPAVPGEADEIRWVQWGTLKTDLRNDKHMFLVAAELVAEIRAMVLASRAEGCNVHLVIEHPVYGVRRSEQQYYLFQSVLEMCAGIAVNVTSISPLVLKNWVKSQTNDMEAFVNTILPPKLTKAGTPKKQPLEKKHIKTIYAEKLLPFHFGFPGVAEIANDDEYDALYLAMFGAVFATDVPDLDLSYWDTVYEGAPEWAWVAEHPAVAGSVFMKPDAFCPRGHSFIRRYANLRWSELGLAEFEKGLKERKFRKPGCKTDFLFNQLGLSQTLFRKLRDQDMAAAKAFLKARGTKMTRRESIERDDVWSNYAGAFYLHQSARMVTRADAASA